MFFMQNPELLPFLVIAFIIGITVHEWAHAYSAYKFGDPTAKMLGRVTFNPAKHVDVFGVILLAIAGFGWAKPVPVDRRNFSNPRFMSIVVSLVGPLSNLVLAIIALFVQIILRNNGYSEASIGGEGAIYQTVSMLVYINMVLFVFNLIPIPPLDGYRIIEDLAPRRLQIEMQKYEHWGLFVFILVVFIDPISRVTIDPLFGWGADLIRIIGNWFVNIL